MLLPTLLVAGCVLMTPEQQASLCRKTDWRGLGLGDGSLGRPAAHRSRLLGNCREVGAPADMTAYRAGRAEGLRSYCSAESGYRAGYAGQRYARVCPEPLEARFLEGYRLGWDQRPGLVIVPSFSIGIGARVHPGVRLGIGFGGHPPGCWPGAYPRCW